MLDLVFYTPGTREVDYAKVRTLMDKVVRSFGDTERVSDDTMICDEVATKGHFHILVDDHREYDLKIKIEVETCLLTDKYNKEYYV